MRPVAVVATLIIMAGCSQPSPTGNPVPAPHASAPAPAGAAPAASAGANVAIVPTIDYPTVVGLPSPRPSQAVPAAGSGGGGNSGGGGGSNGGGGHSGGNATPTPTASQAPPAGATFVSLKLDRMEQSLAGDVLNLTAANGDRLIFQFGATPAAIESRVPGAAVRISIRLPGLPARSFRQAEVEGVLVTYMRVDDQGRYHEWRGAFSKGVTASTLSFDGSATNGLLTFVTRGLVISDGSWGNDGSQLMIDWEMRDVPMALPPSPSPQPSDASAPTPSPSPSAWSW